MADERPLPAWMRVVYGTGEWSLASFGTFRQVFYASFLTDVVGLDPRLASIAAVIGVIWDAVNDPIIGAISDRMKTRWGRRRPFLLAFAVPFGLGFLALWWAPPWSSQVMLAIHCCLAYMLADTLQSLVAVPFYSLTPDLARTDADVTSVTAWRMLFNLIASLAVALAAPSLVDAAEAQGFTPQQGFLMVAALFGGLGMLPFLAIGATVQERETVAAEEPPGIVEVVRGALANRPFRYLAVLYAFNWITFDLVGLMIPFFSTWWVSRGDSSAKMSLLGLNLPPESAALGLMLVLSVPFIPIFSWMSLRIGRRATYVIAMSSMAASLLSLLLVPPGDPIGLVLRGAGCAAGVSAAHVIPDAMIPEVIDWDELQNGKRTEGIYYGAKNLLRKLTGAGAIFFSLQILGFCGYREAEKGVDIVQPESALWAIRLLTGPGGALLLVAAIVTVLLYPLGRKQNAEVAAALSMRRAGISPGSPPSA